MAEYATLDLSIESATRQLSERLKHVPIHICFLCGEGIIQGSGFIQYTGKYLHAGRCFDEYCRITEKPDRNYKMRNGEPIKEFGVDVSKVSVECGNREEDKKTGNENANTGKSDDA